MHVMHHRWVALPALAWAQRVVAVTVAHLARLSLCMPKPRDACPCSVVGQIYYVLRSTHQPRSLRLHTPHLLPASSSSSSLLSSPRRRVSNLVSTDKRIARPPSANATSVRCLDSCQINVSHTVHDTLLFESLLGSSCFVGHPYC